MIAPDVEILRIIDQSNGPTKVEIINQLERSESWINKALIRLQKLELVRKGPGGRLNGEIKLDMRIIRYYLTSLGKKELEAHT